MGFSLANKIKRMPTSEKKGGPTYVTGDFAKYNPKKYIGKYPIKYRSSYELVFFRKLEANPAVKAWASEEVIIPYFIEEKNPKTGKFELRRHNYVTDATVHLHSGQKIICEIKPLAFSPKTVAEMKLSFTHYKNGEKWRYALQWCKQNGYIFKVINETHLKTKIF